MGSKLNQLLSKWPRGTVALQSWLSEQGVTRQLAREYRNSNWLTRIGHGAYIQANDKVDWKGAIFALQRHANLQVWPGGQTALSLQGYAHYLPFNRETVFLFAAPRTRLPTWMKQHDWGVQFRFRPTNLFVARNSNQPDEIDLAAAKYGDFSIRISSLERATFELLYLVSDRSSFAHAAEVMEGLAILRSAVMEAYLKACKSVKVNRLLLFLAEYYQHTWLERVNRDCANLGSGKRQIVKDGVLEKKYQITIPHEFQCGPR
jgi:hypothetical protein